MTQLLVLGLLEKGSMSGYDIKNMLEMSGAESWGGVLTGSIYHALNKLEKDGYIEVSSIENVGHRQKAIYQITEAGEKYLSTLIYKALQTSSVSYPTLLYSGLNFLEFLPREQCVRALEEQKEQLEQQYQALRAGQEQKEEALEGQLPEISRLVFENMYAVIEQQLTFVKRLLAAI